MQNSIQKLAAFTLTESTKYLCVFYVINVKSVKNILISSFPCENLCRQIDYIKRLYVDNMYIKTEVCISYKNIFIKTLLIETLNQNIKTCLQQWSAKTPKKITKNIRARNWTSAEVTLFAGVLADEEHNFATALEEHALKKAANNEAFTLIQKIFDQKRRENHFIEVNKVESFTNAKGVVRRIYTIRHFTRKAPQKVYNTESRMA